MTGIGFPSSLNRVQSTIQRDVAAGGVSATDGTALTAALGDIQAQLAGGTGATTAAATTGTASGTAPASMKDRVNALIDNEVSSGKLTDSQASELKTAFQQAHAHMHGAHGHHGGGMGAIASIGSTDADGQTSDPTGTGTGTGTATDPLTSAATTAVGAIEAFISQFKSAVGSNGVYGATGAGGSSATSLLVNAIG